MRYGKNVLATIFICVTIPTLCFAVTNNSKFTLNGEQIKSKTVENGTWVFISKNFICGTLVNEDAAGLKLTTENYKKANKVGNTYKDVCKIFGGKGSLKTSHEDYNSLNSDEVLIDDEYQWETEDVCITIHFINDKIENIKDNKYYRNDDIQKLGAKYIKKQLNAD